MLREAPDDRRAQRQVGVLRDVVEDDGRRGPVRDGHEVVNDSGLRGDLVVERRGDDQVVGAGHREALRPCQGPGEPRVPDAHVERDPSADLVDCDPGDLLGDVVGQPGQLAR